MTHIGKYVVVRELGQGGMGVVYEARDPALDRTVAVKLVKGPADPTRFLREARAAARIIHPNCVPIFDLGEQDGSPFLVMELVAGMSAADYVERNGPLPPGVATAIVAAACRGIDAVHAAGLVHRDIKPSNLLISTGGTVKVADFGLARAVDGNAPTLTGDRAIGTPHYMSPEQCYAEPADARSDVYSLGATYYVLLTNRYPFKGEHELQVMFAHCNDPVPDPRAVVPGVPEECARIVRRAMAKKPAERYQSAAELLADLEAILAREPTPPLALNGPNAPHPARPPVDRDAATAVWLPGPPSRSGTPTDAVTPVRPLRTRRWLLGLPLVAAAGVGGYFAVRALGPTTAGVGPDGGDGPKPDPHRTPVLVPVRKVGGRVGVFGVAISDDGRWLAVGLAEAHAPERLGGVKLYDRTAGDAPEVWWKWRDDSCNAVAFSPDGKLLAGGFSGSARLRVWSTVEQQEVPLANAQFSGEASGNVVSVAFSPDGKYLAAGSDGWGSRPGRVRVWRVRDGKHVRDLTQPKDRPPQQVRGVSFAPDGRTLATAVKTAVSSQPFIDVWDAETGSHVKTLLVTQATLGPCVAFARHEPLLAYSAQEAVDLTRPATFPPGPRINTGNTEPAGVALSPDGRTLALSVADLIHLFDTETQHPFPAALAGQTGQIYALAFSADGKTLVSGSEVRTVHEWAVPTPPPPGE
ncbi:serine threonine protein kinase : Serine/threonine protein kinase OS=Planctomyces maris DSM 8797 GN=PM8797T_15666 PE=4 SV=1: Pkinase: WD40: WD40 [Gemmataceae bacterium]|nr:serine threonine protein kinase : Serine/threonine protein kinase OS=Planctomyces maris DSM 8797 GN=PM8797T_15666 PE=4 SV=1: Pkinase: WD40: WD40 [Gemmataceae bacterium]VTT99467.1 serine threonine protein kinase : Serine/threonine protein kinase OS=Planctomyces maris DSM 8797 GN=PM8797T_15666 PE=4 SV=1: Pkinase: WD40: WD40 [Gemmataceae bacterium]